jgi:hypothetical protein
MAARGGGRREDDSYAWFGFKEDDILIEGRT